MEDSSHDHHRAHGEVDEATVLIIFISIYVYPECGVGAMAARAHSSSGGGWTHKASEKSILRIEDVRGVVLKYARFAKGRESDCYF